MSKTLIIGASGMLGSALARELNQVETLKPSRKELNLSNQTQTFEYFNHYRPDYVYMCAATVGGIGANMRHSSKFFAENIQIQLNFYEALKKYPVKKALYVGSSCIYPRNTSQPMLENQLMTGEFEPTNEGYALAKMSGIYQAKFLFQEFGIVTLCPIVSNIYGTNDYYDENRSHVIAALIKRFDNAKIQNLPEVSCWGTGIARREFIHVDDVARIFISLMENYNDVSPINVGSGSDISIKELAELIKKLTSYNGIIKWDNTKPDGMPIKCMNVSKLNSLGIASKISLSDGLASTINEYRKGLLNGIK
jgi:GDP-L-fucose synthase